MQRTLLLFAAALAGLAFVQSHALAQITLKGTIVDSASGDPVPARLYIKSAEGKWHHARSVAGGNAVPYEVRRGLSVEVHTSLSAHPFTADLPPGRYALTAERGKEYTPVTHELTLHEGDPDAEVALSLARWTDMAARGWFSGETHVHRKVEDLPTLLLAEDLNVALPLTAWVTDSREAPSRANKNPDPVPAAKLIKVDPTHVIWPVNTEYEIFSVAGKRHTLGAVFILNHRKAFEMTAPPVRPIAEEARRQGALLDLDKHNWPWSMMIVPTMGVQLFELTNNHIWRTRFMFSNWYPEYVGAHMAVERNGGHLTERGWIDFGFQSYYTLLNCGFKMQPTAGTASGVHPVPLGFGRVYVKIDGEFSYEKWMEGLAAGRSFVTTGPMLTADMRRDGDKVKIAGLCESGTPPGGIEVVVNGEVARRIDPQAKLTEAGAYRFGFDSEITLDGSSWVALRTFVSRPDKRPRFAHTAPVHFEVEGKPLRPRKAEVEYLVKRVADELARHEGVLDEAALAEYRDALAVYEKLRATAR